MAAILGVFVFGIAYALVFLIHGVLLYLAMFIAGVPSSFRGFLGLNFIITFPYMILHPILALLVATILFWSLVFKLTRAEHFLNVLAMILVLNIIGFFAGSAALKAAVTYAKEGSQIAPGDSNSFVDEFKRGFSEGFRGAQDLQYADTGAGLSGGESANDQVLDTSGLKIIVESSAENSSQIAVIAGTVKNNTAKPIGESVVSYDFKHGTIKGFGTVTIGPIEPRASLDIRQALNGAYLPAINQESDFVKISAVN